MPRKSTNKKQEQFIYCGNRKCSHSECLRHYTNTPFNVLILRENYKLDKEGNCKDMVI